LINNGPSEGTNESCSGSGGLASLEIEPVAGGLGHKKDGMKQRKFKGPVPEVDATAKGARGLLNARALPFSRALGCRVLTNNSHAPPLKQRPFFPQTRSLRNDLHYHHSEILKPALLFEDIMDSSSGKLQEISLQ
jgi:hypothetical protein